MNLNSSNPLTFPMGVAELQFSLFSDEDISEKYLAWLNDSNHMRYSEQANSLHTYETARRYLNEFKNSPNYFLSIKEQDSLIGTATIYVDAQSGFGNFGLLVDPSLSGRKLGLRIWQILIYEIGPLIGLKGACAGTRSDNKAMLSILLNSKMVFKTKFIREDPKGRHREFQEFEISYSNL